jgi:23S rRNA (adenine2503-C2)-methyltransferase
MVHKKNVKGLTETELIKVLTSLGTEKYRTRQIMEWIYAKGAQDFNAMTNLSKALRDKLNEHLYIAKLTELARQVSRKDGTVKFLFALEDGQTVESVLLRHDYGHSVCISTQVGCALGCHFCASGLEGLVRDLSAGEMIDQVLAIQNYLHTENQRISSVVIMGTGEPLANYDNVLRFIELLHWPHGLNIGYRNITLSTAGIVPGIDRLAGEDLPITLSISLHAPNDQLRSSLMPVNNAYPIAALLAACDRYIAKTNRRITFEYSLIAGVNDGEEHARQLADLLARRLCHVNLIPINAVVERGYRQPSADTVKKFLEILRRRGIETTVRKEMGGDIDAACGQLRRRMKGEGDG